MRCAVPQHETLPEIVDHVVTRRRLRHLNEPVNAGDRVQLHRRMAGSSFPHCPDDNPKANSSSHMHGRGVLEEKQAASRSRLQHDVASRREEKGPDTAALAPGGLGRKPGLAHDRPLNMYRVCTTAHKLLEKKTQHQSNMQVESLNLHVALVHAPSACLICDLVQCASALHETMLTLNTTTRHHTISSSR